MNILGSLFGLWGKAKNQIIYKWGTALQKLEVNGVTGQPDKIATVYTCCRVLSENLSRMPLSIFRVNDEGQVEMARHRLTYLLKFRPNSWQNAQQFWSTVEYHRNYYGNAFVRVYKNSENSYPESLEIIHPGLVREYDFEGGKLIYKIVNTISQLEEPVDAWDILHFRGLSEDGVIGLSPLVAIERQTNINERATSTIDNFYKNNATSPMALETDLPGNLSGPGAGVLKESREQFQKEYAGPENAGKWITLPIGTRLKSIAMQFADAKLIETLRFTREDISAAYGLPLFMVDGSAEKLDVEQLTTLFKNNTMGPIASIYLNEINGKLLTRDELTMGFTAHFDIMSLIGMDFKTLVTGIKDQVVNGLMTPNEGAKKLGNKPIDGEWGNKHYVQAQYIPLEQYNEFSTLKKDNPNMKPDDKNN